MDQKKRNKKKKTSPRTSFGIISIEFVAFLFIGVYLVGYTISSLGKPKIAVEVVSNGQIETPKSFDGLITRDEQVAISSQTGKAFFSYNDSEYVKKGSVVCVVKNVESTDPIEKELSSINKSILDKQLENGSSVISKDIEKINSQIKSIADEKIPFLSSNGSSELYKFKHQLQKELVVRSKMLISAGEKTMTNLADEKSQIEQTLKENTGEYIATEGGILSYAVDGMEQTFTPTAIDKISQEQTKMIFDTGSDIIGDKPVTAGDSLYKIVNSNKWYISAYLDNSVVSEWKEGIQKYLYFKNNSKIDKVLMNIEKIEASSPYSYVVFSSSRYMLEFINLRNIKFSLEDDSFTGLKVPNTAVANKTAIKIPSEFLFEVYGQLGIYVMSEDEKLQFKKVNVLSKGTDFSNISQNFSDVKPGSAIYTPSKEDNKLPGKTFSLADMVTISGVYVANSGTAEFKQVKVLTTNEFYSIVESSSRYGLKQYDTIVTDARTVTDNQIIR